MPRRGQRDRRFIELVERLLERWGYSRTEGKVYAVLLMKARPMTISELAKETGLSRSSISVALSALARHYLVTYRKEGKTKYFSAVPAFLEKFLQQPREILEREIRPMKEIVEGLMENAGEEEKAFYMALLEDLSTLECVLEKLIEYEESEELCLRRNSS
ncbi:GbsR/MarR family transcriptional regulator [Thermococcus sp.]|uniref:GbsR/MarR family transcriptional regulator n=1 Tax=Thermococcus sp. TaxID=35749 RepID=UPI002629539F|nr:helix-turn-helix domain-containing protein [Thermococcus sp.]